MTSSTSRSMMPAAAWPVAVCLFGGLVLCCQPAFAQTENKPGDNVSQQSKAEEDSKEKILADQKRLTEQYELLEKKLFSLYQYEQDQNPDRATLLQNAYQQSREKLTLKQFQTAVDLLTQSRLREAQSNQHLASKQLQELLNLLQSEDRSKRIREQLKRFQEYNKEVGKILRTQQGIRAQTENQGNERPLKEAQQRVTQRTRKLQEKIDRDQAAEKSKQAPSSDANSGQPKSGDPTEGQPKEGGAKAGQPNRGEQNGEKGQPSDQSESPPSDQAPQDPADAANQRLQNAADRMQKAQQKLQQAELKNSAEEMREAERELEQAKRELEKILRQLREEEIERTLDSLEASFRKMLLAEIRLHEQTASLDSSRQERTIDDLEIQSARLSSTQNQLVNDAGRILLVLEDEGSAIATMEAVRQVQTDMQQITQRLTSARTGRLTQQLQQGVIESLSFLVEVFEQAREDQQNRQQKPPSPQEQGQPGEKALLNQLAELKLVRGMQKQILSRHERYSKLVTDSNSEIGHSDDPGLQEALNKLSQRQRKLQQITADIVVGQNQ